VPGKDGKDIKDCKDVKDEGAGESVAPRLPGGNDSEGRATRQGGCSSSCSADSRTSRNAVKPWRRIRRAHSSKVADSAASRPPKAKPSLRKSLSSSSDRARRVSSMGEGGD
jgi:hypothetical protein